MPQWMKYLEMSSAYLSSIIACTMSSTRKGIPGCTLSYVKLVGSIPELMAMKEEVIFICSLRFPTTWTVLMNRRQMLS